MKLTDCSVKRANSAIWSSSTCRTNRSATDTSLTDGSKILLLTCPRDGNCKAMPPEVSLCSCTFTGRSLLSLGAIRLGHLLFNVWPEKNDIRLQNLHLASILNIFKNVPRG